MIKINLVAVERQRSKKKIAFQIGQKLTVLCSLILVAGAAFIGWRYWSLNAESARLDSEITNAQAETVRLRSIIAQVEQFEARKGQLEERVTLIEQLRKDQSGPVHMLDQISRALPPMLWLTELKQGATPNEVLMEGACTTMTGLSDFVANLEASGYFRRSVEIVSSTTDTIQAAPGQLIRFSIKALFTLPGQPEPPPAPTPAAARPRR